MRVHSAVRRSAAKGARDDALGWPFLLVVVARLDRGWLALAG